MSVRVKSGQGRVTGLAAGVAIAAAMAFSTPSHGQFGEAAGIAESMQQDYFRRDIVVISQGLNLDQTQRVIVDALFQDYEAGFEAGREGVKTRFEEMRTELETTDEKRVIKLVFKPFKEWAVGKARLGEEFLDNIKAVLTEEQLAMWPAIDRRLYRDRKLHKGRLSGESLNLFDVMRDMQLDERTAQQVQPLMEAYDVALDQALRRRENSNSADMLDSLSDEDPQKSLEVLHRHIALQVAVRDVNDQYIGRIAEALPADLAEKFRQSALDRAYPRIYREHPVQRLFRESKEIQGLEPSTMQSLVEMEAAFLAELSASNERLRDAVRRHDPVEAAGRADDFAKRMAGQAVEPKPDPTREMFLQRDDMCRTYARQLNSLLTPEQFAELSGGMRWIDMPNENGDDLSSAPMKRAQQKRQINGSEGKTSPGARDGLKESK